MTSVKEDGNEEPKPHLEKLKTVRQKTTRKINPHLLLIQPIGNLIIHKISQFFLRHLAVLKALKNLCL